MSKEEWRDVDGYEGVYRVSSRGRVMRVAGGMGAIPGRVLRPQRAGRGYLQVILCVNCRVETKKVHRLVAEAFLPRPPGCNEVNHKNGDKTDNRVENLEWVTHSQNLKHAHRVLGVKAVRGEAHGCSKLTRHDVKKIRRLYAAGNHTYQELGEMFGVASPTIGQIVRREHWKHIPQ